MKVLHKYIFFVHSSTLIECMYSIIDFIGNVSSLSGSDIETEIEDETYISEAGSSVNGSSESKNNINKNKKAEKKGRGVGSISDSSDIECCDDTMKEKKVEALLATASRHSKVFFENDDGNIFSIYRCLLHNKKVRSFVLRRKYSFVDTFV